MSRDVINPKMLLLSSRGFFLAGREGGGVVLILPTILSLFHF